MRADTYGTDVTDTVLQLGYYTAAAFAGTFAAHFSQGKQKHFKDMAYRSILDGFSEPAGIVGTDGKLILGNKALEVFLGYSEAELMDMAFPTFTIEKYIKSDVKFYERLMKKQIDHYNIDKGWYHKEGMARFGRLTVLPIIFHDDVIASFVRIKPKSGSNMTMSPLKEEPPDTKAPGFELPKAEDMVSSKDHDWRTQLFREITGNKKPVRLIGLMLSAGLIYWLFIAGGLDKIIDKF